ncbi:O-antigen ligase domain-containing protein [Dankookia rubra]|uniref:O-antigen ligase domain-containing protein n=1 Tax=Dankookia rubra TaxID=1442381 RepID=A0A4R5Q543_9PROT|nr:O-antigen ligase family protein [Dankookia rubra]TDH57866.1 O-antigen ligase domain-containing protein [Dankookia rubra]
MSERGDKRVKLGISRVQPDKNVFTKADISMATWTAIIFFVTYVLLVIFVGTSNDEPSLAQNGGGGPIKYVLYSLPITLGFVYYCVFGSVSSRISWHGALAFLLYATVSMLSLASNTLHGFYSVRDIAIISGYLSMYVFWFRAPAWCVDAALLTLALCIAIDSAWRIGSAPNLFAGGFYGFLGLSEASQQGLFGSNGILESSFAFPVGAIALYYFSHRKRQKFLFSLVLLFIAFKRIAFAGIVLALCFDVVVSPIISQKSRKFLAATIVVLVSLTAIFTTQIFEGIADLLDLEETNANSVSLGRYDIAVKLWTELESAPLMNYVVGFGPGSADQISTENFNLNPHNDWLKIIIDYGVIGFVVFHLVFLIITRVSRLGIMIYLYNATLMVTDNVLIYMIYHPFLVLIACVARGHEESDFTRRLTLNRRPQSLAPNRPPQ